MVSTDLNLLTCGSLAKPGPIGRTLRLVLGGLSLYYVFALWTVSSELISDAGSIRPLLWNGIIPGLFFVSYVINIGFSRAWKKWPAIISVIIFALVAAGGFLAKDQWENPILARVLQVWEIYVFSHLGLAFMLAAFIATPGCEMRAFHHLFSKLTGKATKEHICPVGPLNGLDKWEYERKNN